VAAPEVGGGDGDGGAGGGGDGGAGGGGDGGAGGGGDGGDVIPDDPTAEWSSPVAGRALARTRKGWAATVRNVARAVATRGWWRRLGYDAFRDEIMWCDWQGPMAGQWISWTDEDYTRCRIQLEADGFEPVGRELIRDAISLVVRDRVFDSAQLWLNRLRWDGRPRVDAFFERYCSAEPGKYSRAVGAYLWTALAGRVLVPGCKADMVPILVGAQGVGKTTLVAALAPSREFTVTIDLSQRDADLARRLRGRLVVEIAELRGLHTRDRQAINDFVTAQDDTWTPKYREIATRMLRRFVMVGTTNDEQFLADETGNRRWLPLHVGTVDVAAVQEDLEQLWAEAADRFVMNGVEWQLAQDLARLEHGQFLLDDSWSEVIAAWVETAAEGELSTGGGPAAERTWGALGFTSREALVFGLGVAPTSLNRAAEMKVGATLRGLGFSQRRGSRKAGRKTLRVWCRTDDTE
jgi:predicted P-loop ATPase